MARGLNAEQRRAAESPARALAVVAGPGTGKTFTLVERIVYLLGQGAKPSHITAVTFTNQAARELRERLPDLLRTKHPFWLPTRRKAYAVLLCVCPDLALVYERIRFRERRRHLVYK